MRRLFRFSIGVVAAILCMARVGAQPKPQDEVRGIKMTLSIIPVVGDPQSFDVHVELRNAASEPVTLGTAWEDPTDKTSFEDYVLHALSFTTDPETPLITAQTMASVEKPRQLHRELGPSDKVFVDWRTECGCLKPRAETINRSRCLKNPGRYKVRAYFAPFASEGDMAILQSNDVEINFGGSAEKPKASVAHVISSDETGRSVMLDVGRDWKIARGDRFEVMNSLGTGWTLNAELVAPASTLCRVIEVRADEESRAKMGEVPQVGKLAILAGANALPDCPPREAK